LPPDRRFVFVPLQDAQDDPAEVVRRLHDAAVAAGMTAGGMEVLHLPGKHNQASHAGGRAPGGKLYTRGSGTKDDPIVTNDAWKAADALGRGQYVELDDSQQVSTLLGRLHDIGQDAKAKGVNAPVYDLCKVSVPRTNLFCGSSVGVPRSRMPQFKGKPSPGSPADRLPRNARGEVDVSADFVRYAQDRGVGVSEATIDVEKMKASQNELNGVKVAGMMTAMQTGRMEPTSGNYYTTRDGYIIDGHHTWAAQVGLEYAAGVDMQIRTQQLDMPILDALALANEFAETQGLPQAAVQLIPLLVARNAAGRLVGHLALAEGFHLPGKHDQKVHGRPGRGWIPRGEPLTEKVPGGKTPGDPETVEGRYHDVLERARASGTFERGKVWYDTQHDAVGEWAASKGVEPQTFAAMVAATSPQMRWETKDGRQVNLEAAARAVDVARAYPQMPGDQAARAVAAPGMLRRSLADAIDIHNGAPPDAVLQGPKVRNFYNNLTFVDSTRGVTVDVHMARAAVGDHDLPTRQAAKLTEGAGYDWISDRVRNVADRNRLNPAAAQAVIWTQWQEEA
jgi:hypothetical protein